MNYRILGRTGLKVSELSLGCEYVWHSSEKEVAELVHAAVEAGINYIDIFYGAPKARDYFGRALEGIREKVILAGHLGCAEDENDQYVKTRDMKVCEDFIRQFYTRLQTDYIDILFLHNCDEEEDYDVIFNGPMYRRALELQREGKVKFIGISTHNTVIALKAVKSGKIDVLMFPVNPLFNLMPRDYLIEKIFKSGEDLTEEQKRNYPSKQELFEECDRRNIGVVAMKPFAAGRILKNTGEREKNSLMSLTPVQCISYILEQKGVTVALPGFKNVKELEEALAYFTATPEEKDYRAEVEKSDAYKFDNHCMYCNHCLPCPQNINVAEVTKLTDMALKGMTDEILSLYKELDRNAGDCLMCGTCADRCPFSIDVIKNMEQAQQLFHS